MKAVRIHQYGDKSVLRYEDAPMPLCGADDVLIRIIASSATRLTGRFACMPWATMRITSRWARRCIRARMLRVTAPMPSL